MVAERSVGRRSSVVKHCGGIGSEDADMSNDKQSEKLCRRKSKVSYTMLISVGLVGP